MTTRAICENLVRMEGKNSRDRRMMSDVVRRIGKALRIMQDAGMVMRPTQKIKGEFVWKLSQ